MSKECCGCSEKECKECICQSCGMPLAEESFCGTNADGSKNEEYCTYCYKEGSFTEPDLTKEKMIEIGSEYLSKEHNINPEEAKKIMEQVVGSLKRWQK